MKLFKEQNILYSLVKHKIKNQWKTLFQADATQRLAFVVQLLRLIDFS